MPAILPKLRLAVKDRLLTCLRRCSDTGLRTRLLIVGCPWSPRRKARRLKKIRELIAGLGKGQVALHEDEVDIHLNPKIGLDWMGHGQQKEVLTPGQNRKRYLAGALDVRTGELV